MGIEGENYRGSGGREVAELVDIVVNGRTSRRGLLGAVALAVVSGCAAKLKSVVGDEAMIGENYPGGPSSPAVSSSSKERSSDEICRPDGELEVPLDALVMDLPIESRRILAKLKRDEAKADAIVEEVFAVSKNYENLDTVKRMLDLRYDAYMEFRNRSTYEAYFGELAMVVDMVGELDEAKEKLAEAGYLYRVVVAGLLRLPVPNEDADFVKLFKRARMKKLCDLRGKASDLHVISGSIEVSYSQLDAMVPDGTFDIPDVLRED